MAQAPEVRGVPQACATAHAPCEGGHWTALTPTPGTPHRPSRVPCLVWRGQGQALVVLGRNNPSLYTVNGRPLYVHLNGLAIVLLK